MAPSFRVPLSTLLRCCSQEKPASKPPWQTVGPCSKVGRGRSLSFSVMTLEWAGTILEVCNLSERNQNAQGCKGLCGHWPALFRTVLWWESGHAFPVPGHKSLRATKGTFLPVPRCRDLQPPDLLLVSTFTGDGTVATGLSAPRSARGSVSRVKHSRDWADRGPSPGLFRTEVNLYLY